MSVKKTRMRKYHDSNEEISSSCSSSSDSSSDEETDDRDLKSIKEYLSDRRELASQLFKSVKPEKIRLMLPQILKKMDFKELQELCANELSGMSKKRIISMINAQPMLESSDTNESDESGLSLEIISDTEEWLSEPSVQKDNPSNASSKLKRKPDRSKTKSKHSNRKNDKVKTKVKVEPKDTSSKKTKVKIEGEKEAGKKESDSLLDLLELEMRARAIRALIRKEEDIIPTTSEGQNNTPNTKELDKKISMVKQRVINELTSEQLDNMMKQSEEEDVVLVIQPTPIIELLSTDDESEVQKDGEKEPSVSVDKDSTEADKTVVDKNKKGKETDKGAVKSKEKETVKSKDKETDKGVVKSKEKETDKGVVKSKEKETDKGTVKSKDKPSQKETAKEKSKKTDGSKQQKGKKVKKKDTSTLRTKANDPNEKDETVRVNINKEIKKEAESNETSKEIAEKSVLPKTDNPVEKKTEAESSRNKPSTKRVEKRTIEHDLEEIIDLDDYSDDMEDVEDDGTQQNKDSPDKVSNETWASRYYRTDDVQSVIKESKIQSEIRKRLRERQRLTKIIRSVKNTEDPQVEEKTQLEEFNPIGSVQEYLALKARLSPESGQNSMEPTESSGPTTKNGAENVDESVVNKEATGVEDANIQSSSEAEQSKEHETQAAEETDGKSNANVCNPSSTKDVTTV